MAMASCNKQKVKFNEMWPIISRDLFQDITFVAPTRNHILPTPNTLSTIAPDFLSSEIQSLQQLCASP
jgi:hypothetical protein